MPTSTEYVPTDGTELPPPWSIALLSQRDLSLTIPINFVTQPAVSLAAACFSKHDYTETTAKTCLSNLLMVGFRKILVDLYWDAGRSIWSLCPVEIPESAASDDDSAIGSATTSADPSLVSVTMPDKTLDGRQQPTSTLPSSVTESTTSTGTITASPTSTHPPAMIVHQTGETLVEVDAYNCSSKLDISSITSILADYLERTSNTIHASFLYLTFNIHAASSSSTTAASAPAASHLPSSNNSLSNLLNANLSSYLYTPKQLQDDRLDLNESWTSNQFFRDGALAYFTTTKNSNGHLSTSDGWPTEAILEFGPEHYRMLASLGTVDPQMDRYESGADDDAIFPMDSFMATRNVSYTSSGNMSSGCLFDASNTPTEPLLNASWAMSAATQVPDVNSEQWYNSSIGSVGNLTACGISPLVNQTLSDSAAVDHEPYEWVSLSAIWSWAAGEPRNLSSSTSNAAYMRCATMKTSTVGRWVLTDCTETHHAACRVGSRPYEWRISNSSEGYSNGNSMCPPNTTFDTPRTGLENSYLFAELGRHVATHPESYDQDASLWVNLNSLDVAQCWVVGYNTNCPYTSGAAADENRLVVVPTVAAIIVFILAALTFFIKCAANRRTSRRGRRRKGSEGWDYEGVPS
ncbi:lectin C-type domain protein [Phyllosticta citriasiana]|uniref:Maintenance of telomere capping protein 6 n=1 Tax=Phyllosticta citriasiana TaxID=595635 RepID=A0ABR1KXH4_9PEZI